MRRGAGGPLFLYLLAAFLSLALTMVGAKARAEGVRQPGGYRLRAVLAARPAAPVLASLLPSGFEENRGQAPPGSLYMSREGGMIALFDKRGVSFVLPEGEKAAFVPRLRFRLLRMNFGGLRRVKKVSIAGLHRLAGRSSYFIGNNPSRWRVSIPRYEKLSYKGVYPGATFIFGAMRTSRHKNKNALGYDIVLKPGADPGRLRLFFPGAKVFTDTKGDLVVSRGPSRILMLKPEIYQEGKSGKRRIIEGGFVRMG